MSSTLDRKLLRILRDRAPRAVHAGELLTRSGFDKSQFDEISDALGRLREAGMAAEMPGRRYRFLRDTPRQTGQTGRTDEALRPSPKSRGRVAESYGDEGPLQVPHVRTPPPAAGRTQEPRTSRTARAESRVPPREPRSESRASAREDRTDSRAPGREPRPDPRAFAREPRPDSRAPVREPRADSRGTDARGNRVPPARAQGSAPPRFADQAPRYTSFRNDGPTALVRGVLSIHARGFGFVTADDGQPEVFVLAQDIGPAMHGDRVEVEARPSPKGREGRIVGIVQRRRAKLVGAVHADPSRKLVFMPGDPRLPESMRILAALPEGIEVGDAVVAEIREFPQSLEDVAGVVVKERLGAPGELKVEVARILARDGVVEDFPELVAAEAKLIPKKVSAAEAEGRRDLRDVPLATIDPDDARDHDDALYGEALPNGGWRIVIAIADVSHYVRPGTAIDAEALARSTSIYLPDRAIPMLPREISSKIASLLPGEDRLCMGVEVELAPDGSVRDRVFFEGVMRSRARITYGGAARALGLTKQGRKQKEADAMLPSLTALLDASRKRRVLRERRGSIDFDLPEAKVTLGDDGIPTDVVESRRDPGVREAYRLVEEMMLLANELVAEHLTSLNLPAIHRIHPAPEEKRIETFCQLAYSLGHELDPEDAANPRTLARFVAKTADSPEAPFVRFLLLRAMQQASYSLDPNVGHFGLGARHYLHFTSPIRRYPDLAVHRVLRALLRNEPFDRASLVPKLRMQAAESSRLERRAMTIDREVEDVYEIVVMRERIGDTYEGAIASVESDRFTVRLDSPFVDVIVELQRLSWGEYELDPLGLRLTSRSGHHYGMGDRIRVTIVEANLATRRVIAMPVDVPKAETRERPSRRKKEERRSSKDGSPSRARVDSKKEGRKKPRRR